jgi:GntR family transcriptional regulator
MSMYKDNHPPLGTLPVVEPPEIRPYAADPPYRQIAAWLRARIEAGDFSPDDPLPSEKSLVGTFGVARETARKAVQVLRDEGLVVTVAHRGTYVVPPGQDS